MHSGSFAKLALQAYGVPVIEGGARFVGPGCVEADGVRFDDVAVVVIATGARAAAPRLPGQPKRPALTNDDVMALDHAPARVVIAGSGRFSIEWADFLQAMGSDVTVVCDSGTILSREDPDLAGFLQLVLEERGVCLVMDATIEAVDGRGGSHLQGRLGCRCRRVCR